jgi:NifB/MoaA-like Fe-S oxidoreductase
MHAPIVLVPDWNDGVQLERSVRELARLHPHVATTAVVPVGLTRHRERLPELRTLTGAEASLLARTIEGWQREFRDALGTRFVWASDEVYLEGGRQLPAAAAYEGFPVIEDGIGLVRRFSDGFARAARRLPARVARERSVTVVTGALFAPRMRRLLDRISIRGLRVELARCRSETRCSSPPWPFETGQGSSSTISRPPISARRWACPSGPSKPRQGRSPSLSSAAERPATP